MSGLLYVLAVALLVAAVAYGARKTKPVNEPATCVIGYTLMSLPLVITLVMLGRAAQLPIPGACPAVVAVDPGQVDSAITKTLKIKDAATTKISLGSDEGPANAGVLLDIDPQPKFPAARPVAVHLDYLRRGDNPDVSVAATARAEFTSPSTVTLWLCVQRAGGADRPTGTPTDVATTIATTSTPPSAPPPTLPGTGSQAPSNARLSFPTTSLPAATGTPSPSMTPTARTSDASTHSDGFTLDPGLYAGSVTIIDSRLPNTTVPFTVSLSYPTWPLVLVAWCLTVLFGGIYLSVIRTDPKADTHTTVNLRLYPVAEYLSSPLGLASVIAGAAAALGVFASSYLTSQVWGASTSDWLTLVGAMFGAFVTAGTAFRFANTLAQLGSTPPSGQHKAGDKGQAPVTPTPGDPAHVDEPKPEQH